MISPLYYRKSRRGMTLVELMVSLTVMMTLVTFSAGMISSQISYFQARVRSEQVVSAVRLAQNLARVTHITDTTLDLSLNGAWLSTTLVQPRYGISLFRPAGTVNNYSYLVYRENDPEIPVPRPPPGGPVNLLDDFQATHRFDMDLGTVFTARWNSATPNAAPVALPNSRLEFDQRGALDLAASDEENLTRERPIPADTGGDCYTFDVVNRGFGYIRVRIRSSGTVERSGVTELDQVVTTRYGQPF